MENNGKAFYPHLHAFRGFAILTIVAAHCWVMLLMIGSQGQVSDALKPIVAISETLFHNSTIYFAIISGLLFSLVMKNYTWKRFYLGKLKNVFIPYLIFSILFAFLGGMVLIPPTVEPLSVNAVISAIPMHIITGSSFGHMWYIPVLLMLFLLTPVFKIVVNNKKCLPIFVVIILIPLMVSRSWPDFTWKNYVFFFAPYTLGMMMGNHYQQTLALFEKYKSTLWLIVALTTAALLFLYLNDIEAVYGVKLQESVGYINKVAICMLVLTYMNFFENKLPKLLNTLGNYSFSIYFLHMVFVIVFAAIMVNVGLSTTEPLNILVTGGLLFILTFLTSIAFAWLIKKMTGKYSRLIIGS